MSHGTHVSLDTHLTDVALEAHTHTSLATRVSHLTHVTRHVNTCLTPHMSHLETQTRASEEASGSPKP